MGEEITEEARRSICNHPIYGRFMEKRFDIINGFELVSTRCHYCHKILLLEVNSLNRDSVKPESLFEIFKSHLRNFRRNFKPAK